MTLPHPHGTTVLLPCSKKKAYKTILWHRETDLNLLFFWYVDFCHYSARWHTQMHSLCRQHDSYHIQRTVRWNGPSYLQVLVGKTIVNEIKEMKVKEQIFSCTGHRCGAMASGAMWLCGPGAVLDWSWPITASSSRPPGVGHNWALHLACPHIASLRGSKNCGQAVKEWAWVRNKRGNTRAGAGGDGGTPWRQSCLPLTEACEQHALELPFPTGTDSPGSPCQRRGKKSVRGLEQQRETGWQWTYLVPLCGETWWGACQGVEESDMKKWCWGVVWVFVFIAHYPYLS